MLVVDQQLKYKAERSTLFGLLKLGFFLNVHLKNVQPHNNFTWGFGVFKTLKKGTFCGYFLLCN